MYDLLSKDNVLIVDDFSQFRLTIKTMLHKLGAMEIDQASNAVEAMKRCVEKDYDIIFCDYNMGDGQDGQQFLEELHQRSMLLKGSLFLMVTAETTSAQVMGAIEYRPDAYLTKPFTNEQLGQRLKRLLDKNESLKPIHQAINQNDFNSALTLCDETIGSSPSLRFSCLRLKSEILEQQNNHDELMALYTEVIQQQPLLWAVLGVGKIHFERDDFSTALDHFQAMRENFPQQVSILDWIAKCQHKLGETEKAEATLLEAINISPKSVSRQANLGGIAKTLGHHDIAQKAFKKTIDEGFNSCLLKPEHYQDFFDNTLEISSQLSGRELSQVLAHTETLAKKMERKYHSNPTAMASNLSSMAALFSSTGRTSQAEGFLSKLKKNLHDPQCKISQQDFNHIEKNLALLSEDNANEKFLEDINARMEQIKEEIVEHKAKEKTARSINREGMKYARQNEPQQALEKFREAIRLVPQNSNYLLNATQTILVNEQLKSNPDRVAEARSFLQSIAVENTGKRWRLYKKLKEYLPDE